MEMRCAVGARASVRVLALIAAQALLAGCMNDDRVGEVMSNVATASMSSELVSVAQLRVLFAHQSVGGNMLAGMSAISADSGVALEIREQSGFDVGRSGVAHLRVGENGKPELKIAEFVSAVDASLVPPNVAILKLCYSDFDNADHPERIADDYIAALDSLQAKHPQTKFIAMTAPLTTLQTGPKAWIKMLLGRPVGGYVPNVRRGVFNERVRSHFSADRLFDIARLEAQGIALDEREPLEAMNPLFTSDGGHLNAAGQRHIASEFVKFLSLHASQ